MRALLLVALTASFVTACTDGRAPVGEEGGTVGFGSPCTMDTECPTGPCVPVGGGEGRCSAGCIADSRCPAGWRCETNVCACNASVEVCDSLDNDCDGHVDEGAGAAIGCGPNEICGAIGCTCGSVNQCEGRCVDLAGDPANCGTCGTVCPSGACADGRCCTVEAAGGGALDLLLLIDNSNSMGEEQYLLVDALPALLTALTSGSFEGSTFAAYDDIHVGVVTTDMGVGGFVVPTCASAAVGQDGQLQTVGDVGCGSYPTFLTYSPGGSVATLADDVGCLVVQGTSGCGFEQPLESVLKALSPSAPTDFTAPGYVAPVFASGSGHGDGANAGFSRAGATLVMVLLTDEEDCSARDPDIFNPASSTYGATDLNLRCFAHSDALFPVSRYVDGLLQLRASPSDVVFLPIAGIPSSPAPGPLGASDFDAILADPGMQEQIDPSMPTRLLTSCSSSNGSAYPPRRIVEVAAGLGARGARVSAQSLCRDTLDDFVRALVATLNVPRVSCR